jgi:hypothetical protein
MFAALLPVLPCRGLQLLLLLLFIVLSHRLGGSLLLLLLPPLNLLLLLLLLTLQHCPVVLSLVKLLRMPLVNVHG